MVAHVRKDLCSGLDRVEVVAVELLGDVAVGVVVGAQARVGFVDARRGGRARTDRAATRSRARTASGASLMRARGRAPDAAPPTRPTSARAARARRPSRARGERPSSPSSSLDGGGQRVEVAGRDDAAGAERAHGLAEARRRRRRRRGRPRRAPAGARPTGRAPRDKERRRRSPRRARDRARRCEQIAEPPLDALGAAEPVERHCGVACDEQPRLRQSPRHLDRIGEALVRPDHTERQDRRAVVGARRRARIHGVGDDARVDIQLGERLAPALRVDDDAIEALEQAAPEIRA